MSDIVQHSRYNISEKVLKNILGLELRTAVELCIWDIWFSSILNQVLCEISLLHCPLMSFQSYILLLYIIPVVCSKSVLLSLSLPGSL